MTKSLKYSPTRDEVLKALGSVSETEYKKLEQQLAEANEVIKKYRVVELGLRNNKGTLESVCPAFDYLEKWGVK